MMAPGEYFARYWAHCPPVADLAESLAGAAAAAAAEGGHAGPANPRAYQAHLSEAALDDALALGTAVLVRTTLVHATA